VKQELSATSQVSIPHRFSRLLLAALALTLGNWASQAEQSVSLAWDANAETNIVGYRLYYGTTSQGLTNTVDTGGELTATVTGLKEGTTYYFAVTARNSDGLESLPIDQVSFTVPRVSLLFTPAPSPADPTRLRFEAISGYAYEILASEDLETWVTIYYTTPTVSGWMEYADLDSPTFPSRFYRLIRH